MRRPRRVTPETAIFEGLETLLRLARDARAGGVGQGPMVDVGSVVGVFSWGTTPVWSRGGTGKGRFGEAGDKACKSLDLALKWLEQDKELKPETACVGRNMSQTGMAGKGPLTSTIWCWSSEYP